MTRLVTFNRLQLLAFPASWWLWTHCPLLLRSPDHGAASSERAQYLSQLNNSRIFMEEEKSSADEVQQMEFDPGTLHSCRVFSALAQPLSQRTSAILSSFVTVVIVFFMVMYGYVIHCYGLLYKMF